MPKLHGLVNRETGKDLEVQGGEVSQEAESSNYHVGHFSVPFSVPKFLQLLNRNNNTFL